uniref:Uncharacterized protein n=1 Tax=Ananas comosus var. bracteatus TaxID=296719 RepID=A0A6V7PA86_ANACO|nr:unnamed protein product [Ananas comosus var. bracteatus]
MATYANLAEMYVGDDVSLVFYAWVFPKCDHVVICTGTDTAKLAIRCLQAAARAQAAPRPRPSSPAASSSASRPTPSSSGGAVGPIGVDDDVNSEGGGDRTDAGVGGAGGDVVGERWFGGLLGISSPNLHYFWCNFRRNGAILGEICTISPPPPPPFPSSSLLRMPAAHLGRLDYDQSGMLGVRMALMVVAENDNCVAVAGFLDVGFMLSFHWIDVTLLRPAQRLVAAAVRRAGGTGPARRHACHGRRHHAGGGCHEGGRGGRKREKV